MTLRMFTWLAIVCAGLAASARMALAQEDAAAFGTQSVIFKQSGTGPSGLGCSLIYTAVAADASYNNGKPALIAGNIGVTRAQGRALLTLKIGFADLEHPNGRFAAPYFAYLQNGTSTTGKRPYSVFADTGGLRVTVALDEVATSLVREMLETGYVTIAFNPRQGMPDRLLPIDLTVVDTIFVAPNRHDRKRSSVALRQFGDCFREVQESPGIGPPI